jgi:hypothetical protein
MSLVLRAVVLAALAALLAAPASQAAITVTHESVQVEPPAGPVTTGLRIVGDGVDDDVTISQTPSGEIVVSRAGGGIAAAAAPCSGGGAAITCPAAQGISADLAAGNDKLTPLAVAVPITAAGGPGDDTLTGGAAADVLAGGSESDTLSGGAGVDEYFGETGGDIIVSRDGAAERIACGAGDDRVDNDFTDIIAECERGTDNDGDGFSTAVDCDDTRANVFPAAPDAVENGVDEDCDGQDDRNLDRDGDAFAVPLDCNDGDPAIRPGTLEIRGNAVDENCDKRVLPFAVLPSLVSTRWQVGPRVTRLRKLVVRNAPAGARVTVTCDGPGCTFKGRKSVRVRRDLAPVRLHRFFGKGKLRSGARVDVTITATGMIGRRYRYKIERTVLPAAAIRCLVPGTKGTRAC